MAKFRMRIAGFANGSYCPIAGEWLMSYDADADKGRGFVETTKDPGKAMVFEGHGKALECYRRQSTTRPLRADGRPNRPLTASTVVIEPVR